LILRGKTQTEIHRLFRKSQPKKRAPRYRTTHMSTLYLSVIKEVQLLISIKTQQE